MSTPELSVAICTYNRAESLADTLEYLCRQEGVAKDQWELLLIDNNCTDDTADVAERFGQRLPLHYLVEKQQGLSYGRNRAMAECRGNLLIFTDDDTRPVPAWLAAYGHALSEFPDAVYLGGPIVPYWPSGKPGWVRDINMPLLGGLFGSYDQGKESHYYDVDEMHPYGANFALRRQLWERQEGFRTDLGVTGDLPGRGEEAEYLGRARKTGVRGAYIAAASVQHRVEPSHLKLSYMYQYGLQKGIASRKIHGESESHEPSRWFSYLSRGLFQLLKGRGDRFRQCVINMGIEQGRYVK